MAIDWSKLPDKLDEAKRKPGYCYCGKRINYVYSFFYECGNCGMPWMKTAELIQKLPEITKDLIHLPIPRRRRNDGNS